MGCESESPQYIVIFNVEDNETVTVIKPLESDSAILVDWLSNDELVYGQFISVEGYKYPFYHYFTYSISRGMSTEFLTLTLTTSDGYQDDLWEIDWTSNGQYIAGIPNSKSLIVVDNTTEDQNVSYITDTYNSLPLWSPSGSWIVYISSPDYDAFLENGEAVKITDRAGQTIIDTDILNIKRRLGFAWLHSE
jgi:WD40 repeat protein